MERAEQAIEPSAAPSRFLEILKTWLLCGWITNKAALLKKPGYMEVGVRSMSSKAGMGQNPYVPPTRWTQIVRKCRARFRGASSGCYNAPQASDYYKMESYERNFDRGREFWEDFPIVSQDYHSERWEAPNTARGIPVNSADSSIPHPVWMIAASQEDIKQKAAAIARAKA